MGATNKPSNANEAGSSAGIMAIKVGCAPSVSAIFGMTDSGERKANPPM